MDTNALSKRLARTGGLACMIAGGLLCGLAVRGTLNNIPDASLDAAINATIFGFGAVIFLWSKRP